MNFLNLVGPLLDNICQIRQKWYYSSNLLFFLQSKLGVSSMLRQRGPTDLLHQQPHTRARRPRGCSGAPKPKAPRSDADSSTQPGSRHWLPGFLSCTCTGSYSDLICTMIDCHHVHQRTAAKIPITSQDTSKPLAKGRVYVHLHGSRLQKAKALARAGVCIHLLHIHGRVHRSINDWS
jgi:hypothetical protein